MCTLLMVYLFTSACYVYGCFVWVCLCTSEKNTGSHETTGTEGCKPPCGCWELYSGPPEKQPVFLTMSHLCSPDVDAPYAQKLNRLKWGWGKGADLRLYKRISSP